MSSKPTIGFIGVGLMGHGMAKNLVTKGHPLVVLGHRNRKPVESLVSMGAKEAKNARDLASQVDIKTFQPRQRIYKTGDPGGRAYVLTQHNELHALCTDTGEEIWLHTGIQEVAGLVKGSSVAVASGLILVPYTSGELVALRADNGREPTPTEAKLYLPGLARISAASSFTVFAGRLGVTERIASCCDTSDTGSKSFNASKPGVL